MVGFQGKREGKRRMHLKIRMLEECTVVCWLQKMSWVIDASEMEMMTLFSSIVVGERRLERGC